MPAKKRPMDLHAHHQELVDGLSEQLKPLLDSSAQAVYIYLDDTHKTCNKKFASLLGYSSPKAWANADVNFVETFLDEKSQDTVVSTYHGKLVKKLSAGVIPVTWKKKTGGKVKTTVTAVPITYHGHLFALGFVSK